MIKGINSIAACLSKRITSKIKPDLSQVKWYQHPALKSDANFFKKTVYDALKNGDKFTKDIPLNSKDKIIDSAKSIFNKGETIKSLKDYCDKLQTDQLKKIKK